MRKTYTYIEQRLSISIQQTTRSAVASAMVFLVAAGVILLVNTGSVFAASPGCYSKTTTSGDVTYTKVDCPSTVTDTVNKCWVAVPSRSGPASYSETDCSTFTEAASPTSTGGTETDTVNPLEGIKASSPDAENLLAPKVTYTCGNGDGNVVHVAFDFGCVGSEYGKPLNPIIDIAFAIFRFLSAGVGLVVIGSIIVAGIQYSSSRGNPQATQAAIKRISSSVVALLLFIFMFAIANFLVPGGMFIK